MLRRAIDAQTNCKISAGAEFRIAAIDGNGFGQRSETSAMANTVEDSRLVLDGKIKAPPTVALIVVVGVEVKGASHEFACWRFSRYALQINVPGASKYYNAVFGAFLNRLDREAWRRFRRHSARIPDSGRGARRRFYLPAYDKRAGPAPPRQGSRSARPAPPAYGLD